MSALDALIAQVEASRLRSYTADDGRVYRFEIPSLFGVQRIVNALRRGVDGGDELTRIVGEALREWSGVTEADLLGAAVGSDKPADYHPRLWRVVAGKDPALVFAVATEMVTVAGDEHAKAEAVAGE